MGGTRAGGARRHTRHTPPHLPMPTLTCSRTMDSICSRLRPWKTMNSSMRLMNSGRKCMRTCMGGVGGCAGQGRAGGWVGAWMYGRRHASPAAPAYTHVPPSPTPTHHPNAPPPHQRTPTCCVTLSFMDSGSRSMDSRIVADPMLDVMMITAFLKLTTRPWEGGEGGGVGGLRGVRGKGREGGCAEVECGR